ncbi:MAG: ribbon-helix-helix domain-containing protein, partial [Kiloniellales bacterium]
CWAPSKGMSNAGDTRIRKRSVTLAGHKTSLSLEDAFWRALKDLARDEGLSANALVARIDRAQTGHEGGGNLSSAVRVHVLRCLQDKAGRDR